MESHFKATEFDALVSSASLQMMKALLPFLEPSMQQWAAFYIQTQELQNAIALFQTPGHPSPWPKRPMPPASQLLEELRPYGGPSQWAALDQMKHAMEAMKLYQTYTNLQKQASGPVTPMDLIKEILPPEQAAMFETYSTMFQGMDLGTIHPTDCGSGQTGSSFFDFSSLGL